MACKLCGLGVDGAGDPNFEDVDGTMTFVLSTHSEESMEGGLGSCLLSPFLKCTLI